MRWSNGLRSLVLALLASGFVACTANVRDGSGEASAQQGALEGDGKNNGSGEGEVSEGNELPPPVDPPPPVEPPLPPACTQGIVESAACEDPGLLKDLAYAICQEDGLGLTAFDYQGGDCGWMTTQAHYECCPLPPPVDPPPPPPPPICASGSLGDGVTCQPRDLLKQAAYEACEQAGLQLFNLIDDGDCSPAEAAKMTYFCTGVDGVCP
ncbi:hypothetical protein [Polyangium sp. 15x6]|uniref:hypothetical protein n=1 Tax=Polyangium sp. 15x6 TaxID=3042687 RepID=UPI00249B4090|nr:hypothetical protein [Polyangium sp. 15x6]MDI3290811.1 hypothetical protein [Polyangium sp. 15x6]